MRGFAHLLLLLAMAMMAFAPGIANALPAPVVKQDPATAACHEGAEKSPTDHGKRASSCLALCLAGHGAVMPVSLPDEPPYTPLPYSTYAMLMPVLVSSAAGIDPPPPRQS